MKIKDGFVLRKVGGQYVAVATGARMMDFNAMISTNETGAFLWELLKKGADRAELAAAMTAEYDVSEKDAAEDIDEFLRQLRDAGIAE